ncbi:MAG TPA: hypothetical protein VN428_07870 [Bryobacteraceae bacterium]|nr:hypothetical protein [Bryobacteraceae bacterium]
MNTSDPKTHQRTVAASTRNILIAAVVSVVLLLSGYLWGHLQTRSQLSAQQMDHEQRIGAVQEQLEGAQADLTVAGNRNQLLMARIALHQTAADLDARNFGTANTRLQEAATALGKVDAALGGIDADKLATLRAAIATTSITVAADLQAQRNQVLDLAAQLDALARDPATR